MSDAVLVIGFSDDAEPEAAIPVGQVGLGSELDRSCSGGQRRFDEAGREALPARDGSGGDAPDS